MMDKEYEIKDSGFVNTRIDAITSDLEKKGYIVSGKVELRPDGLYYVVGGTSKGDGGSGCIGDGGTKI